jgi:hypothetical protein
MMVAWFSANARVIDLAPERPRQVRLIPNEPAMIDADPSVLVGPIAVLDVPFGQ